MLHFLPGNNTELDTVLDIIHPHSTPNFGSIGLGEIEKIQFLVTRKRHLTFRLLHLYGTTELIEELWRKKILEGGHRLKFSTRIDEIFEQMEIASLGE